jgi:hypothetical protein
MVEAQKAGIRVLLCGTIPDPDPTVDAKLKLLDDALQDLEMGPGNNFVGLRSLLFKDGQLDLKFYRKGDIHLSEEGVKVVGPRIRLLLDVMCPPQTDAVQTAAVQTTAVQTAAVQTPVVVQPQVQQLIGQVQDLVIHHVAVPDPQLVSPMEVEDEDEILQRLYLKKFGCALPEVRVRNEVDEINFVIDLTEEEEMEADAAAVPNVIPITIKTEPIEIAEIAVANVAKLRQERRELVKARKAIVAFGKSLRKSNVIPEKEVPTPENVVANPNMSEDRSIESVNPVIPVKSAEQITAESNAEIEADQKEFVAEFGDIPLDEFDDESEFRLYSADKDDVIEDDDDAMINDV